MVSRIKLRKTAYWFTCIMVMILLGIYGKDIMVWIFSKLYGFFIQHNPVIK